MKYKVVPSYLPSSMFIVTKEFTNLWCYCVLGCVSHVGDMVLNVLVTRGNGAQGW